MVLRALALAAAALALAGPARAEPTVANAWMRPALAGATSADAYADLSSDVPITLVAVRTPVARKVEIVVHNPRDPASVPRVVDRLELPVGETRFALRGSVLRLLDVNVAVSNGTPVPMTFEFASASGATIVVEAPVQVRGLVAASPTAR
jgi:copper(I)-binding protein